MKCQVCGSEQVAGKKFCSQCGSPLPKQKFCPKCGKPIQTNQKFCRSCGSKNPFYEEPKPVEPDVQSEQVNFQSPSVPVSEQAGEVPAHQVNETFEIPINPDTDSTANQETFDEPESSGHGGKLALVIILVVLALVGAGLYFLDDIKSATGWGSAPKKVTETTDTVSDSSKVNYADLYASSVDKENEMEDSVQYIVGDVSRTGRFGLSDGHNQIDGNMIHTDGRKFPFVVTLDYNMDNDTYSNVVYKNVGSGTTLKLKAYLAGENSLRIEGKDGKKDFSILLNYNTSDGSDFYGEAYWGDFRQDIEADIKK